MLGIDISALSHAELRQLLDVARARGQQALVEQLTAELQARPARSAQWGTMQPWAMRLAVETPPAPRRRSLAVAVTSAAAGIVAAALMWGVSMPSPSPSAEPIKIAAPRAAVALAAPEPEPAPELAPQLGPAIETVAAAPARTAGRNPCYDLPTPADRLVCGYPSLSDRERRLRTAYQAAIAAGAEPRALEDDQAAWKGERDGVWDRLALAEMYDERIRQLSEAAQ